MRRTGHRSSHGPYCRHGGLHAAGRSTRKHRPAGKQLRRRKAQTLVHLGRVSKDSKGWSDLPTCLQVRLAQMLAGSSDSPGCTKAEPRRGTMVVYPCRLSRLMAVLSQDSKILLFQMPGPSVANQLGLTPSEAMASLRRLGPAGHEPERSLRGSANHRGAAGGGWHLPNAGLRGQIRSAAPRLQSFVGCSGAMMWLKS